MGVTGTTGEPVGRPLPNALRAPLVVAAGAHISRSGEGGGDGDSRLEVGDSGAGTSTRRGGDDGWGGGKGDDQVGEGGGYIPTIFPRRGHHRGGGLSGGGPDTQKGRGIPWHNPRVGDLEGGVSDSQLPLHRKRD